MLLVCLEVVMPIRDNVVLLDLIGFARTKLKAYYVADRLSVD